MGRGFQTVQRRVAPSTERDAASLTTKGLDALGLAMLAIPDEGVDVRIGDAEVRALLVGTGKPFSIHSLGRSPTAFYLNPGAYWSRGRFHTWRSETTARAIKWSAGLEETVDQRTSLPCLWKERLKKEPAKTPKQRQKEDEEGHEQQHKHLIGHNNPRCLKSGAERAPVSGSIRTIEKVCQAIGKEGRIIHHRQRLYPWP
jgi:hypothetical protein